MSPQDDTLKAPSEEAVLDEATQENSPRQSTRKSPRADDTKASASSPTPASHTTPHSVPPQSESVRIPGVSTVVSWSDAQGREHVLSHDVVSAFIQYDPKPKNKAFVRLRIKLGQNSRRTPKHIFLFIPPEHIETLSFQNDNESSELGSATKAAIRGAVGTAGVVCLSFEMRKSCFLVGPKDLDPSSQNQENIASHIVNMLDTVTQLSLQRTFVVCIPRTTASEGFLLPMCHAVSTPGLLTSDPTLKDINGLYRGQGGVIIGQRPQLSAPSVDQLDLERTPMGTPLGSPLEDEAPPSYEQAGSTAILASASSRKGTAASARFIPLNIPSIHVNQELTHPEGHPTQASAKRRRTVSSELSEQAPVSSKSTIAVAELPPAALDLIMARMDQGFGQINTRLTNMEARIEGMESRMTQLETRPSLRGSMDETGLEDLRYDLEKQIVELREEAEDLLDNRVEEVLADAKRELTDHVEDQVDDVKKDIIARIGEASVQCSVNFDFR